MPTSTTNIGTLSWRESAQEAALCEESTIRLRNLSSSTATFHAWGGLHNAQQPDQRPIKAANARWGSRGCGFRCFRVFSRVRACARCEACEACVNLSFSLPSPAVGSPKMKVFVALMAIAGVALAIGAAVDLPGDNGPPAGYAYATTGTQEGGASMRFTAAFEASSLIGTETKKITESACAALCDNLDICRAYFYWNDGFDNRCRLLRHDKQLFATKLTSVSAVKLVISNYNIAAVGKTEQNQGEALRFANAFNQNDHVFQKTLLSLGQVDECLNECNGLDTCEAVYLFWDGNFAPPSYRCFGLKNAEPVYISTNVKGWSLGRINAVNDMLPSGYTLVEEGKTISNNGLPYRFRAAFGDHIRTDRTYSTIHETDVSEPGQCATRCKGMIDCQGALHYKKSYVRGEGAKWSCRLLHSIDGGNLVLTETKSYSIKRDTEPALGTVSTGAVTGTSGKWTDAVLAPNGKLYAAPRFATRGLIIDPQTNAFDTTTLSDNFDLNGGAGNSYVGSVLVDKKLYAIPYSANNIAIIDTETDTTLPAASFSADVNTAYNGKVNKWTAGALLDGMIYASPFNANDVLVIDTTDNNDNFLIPLPSALTSATGNALVQKFVGAIAYGSKIVFIPYSAESVAFLSTSGGSILGKYSWSLVSVAAGTGKWNGGFLAANSFIYGAPLFSNFVVKINPATEEVWESAIEVPVTKDTTKAKWKAPAATIDHKVFHLFPNAAASVLSIDTEVDVAKEFFVNDAAFGNSNQKYSGSVASPATGKIFGTPYRNDNAAFVQL